MESVSDRIAVIWMNCAGTIEEDQGDDDDRQVAGEQGEHRVAIIMETMPPVNR